jgi:NAD(P)-dependent dehydrogenase (short-subunit alcohol dehydrogenase family)
MSDQFRVDGKTALVTGASRGFGRHFALTLARAGAAVVLAARSMDALEAVAEEVEAAGGRAAAVEMDVTQRDSVIAGLEAAETALGPVTLLVNNAGVVNVRPLLEQSEADWRDVIETNLTGAWFVAQETARHMAEHGLGGVIVNIASMLGLRTIAQVPGYCAAKAGLIHLTRAMAMELARHQIRVNALAPGYVETDFNADFFAGEAGQALIRRIPQRRLGHLEDLDGPLLFLASDASRYVTGEVITVDGGHAVAPV